MDGNKYVIDGEFEDKSTKREVIFEVKDHSFSGNRKIGIVPVIIRYVFRWGLYESDKEIVAKFERYIDPKIEYQTTWQEMDKTTKYHIESNVKELCTWKPFSILLKDTQGSWTGLRAGRVVEKGTRNQRWEIEYAPSWSRMESKYIEHLSNEMKRVFGMDLHEMREFDVSH